MKCPNTWTNITVGELLTFMTSGSRGWAKHYSTSGRLFLRIQNVGKNRLLLDDVAYVQPNDDAESRRTLVKTGDVLLSMTADLGRTAVVPEWLGEAHINQHLAILRVKDIDPYYLSAFLASPIGQRQIFKLDKGGVKAGLNFEDIRSVKILVPPLSEQKRIVEILGQADALRRKRQQALALTQQFLRSTFLDLFGDPVANPKRWPVVRISDFVEELEGGKNIKTDDSPSEHTRYFILKVSAVTWGEFRAEESKPVPKDFVPPSSYFVKSGDLLMSRANTRELIGAVVFVEETPPNIILPDKIWRLVWKEPVRVVPEFAHALLNHHSVRTEIGRRASGTSGSMKNISKPKLLSIEVPLPPLRLQESFATTVAKFRRIQINERESAENFDALFNSLVQRAFQGDL